MRLRQIGIGAVVTGNELHSTLTGPTSRLPAMGP